MYKMPEDYDLDHSLANLSIHLDYVVEASVFDEGLMQFEDEDYSSPEIETAGEGETQPEELGNNTEMSPLENVLADNKKNPYNDEYQEILNKYQTAMNRLSTQFTLDLKELITKHWED